MSPAITIRMPHSRDEATRVLCQIEQLYMRHVTHRAESVKDLPDVLILVERNGELVGAAAFFLAEIHSPVLPTEYIFDLKLRGEYAPGELIEIGRVVAFKTLGEVIIAAAAGAKRVAQLLNAKAVLGCMKPQLLRRMRTFGVYPPQLDATVVPERVPKAYRHYFLGGEAPVPLLLPTKLFDQDPIASFVRRACVEIEQLTCITDLPQQWT